MNAEQRAAFRFDCGGQPFWQENERTIRVLALIGDLIRLSQAQLVFHLLFFERTQIGEENRIRIKCPRACCRFGCIKIARRYSLAGDGERPRLKVNIIPCKPECLADSQPCVIEYFEQRMYLWFTSMAANCSVVMTVRLTTLRGALRGMLIPAVGFVVMSSAG